MLTERSKETRPDTKRPLILMVSDGTLVPPIWEYTQGIDCPVHIALVVSNKGNSKGLEFAAARGIKTAVLEWNRERESRWEFSSRTGQFVCDALPESAKTDGQYLVVAAGWPVIMTKEFLQWFGSGRVINLHRGLVSKDPQDTELAIEGKRIKIVRGLYGMEMCKAVLNQKLEWTGSSVHFMTEDVDVGKVILHGIFPVEEGDTVESLNEKIYREECKLVPKAIDIVVRGVRVLDTSCG